MKTAIFFIIALLVSMDIKAQSLAGKYVYNFPAGNSMQLEFKSDSFSRITGQDLGSDFGKGRFKITDSKLTLIYGDWSPKDTSYYKLTESRSQIKDAIVFDIRVYHSENLSPFPYAYCILRKKNYDPVLLIHTDTAGKVNFKIYDTSIYNTLTIDYMGYNRIAIPLAPHLGKTVKLEIRLTPQTKTYAEKHEEVYTIEKLSSAEMILINEDGNKMIFRKIED